MVNILPAVISLAAHEFICSWPLIGFCQILGEYHITTDFNQIYICYFFSGPIYTDYSQSQKIENNLKFFRSK